MMKSVMISIRNYCAYQERCHSEVRNKLLELGARGLDLEDYIVHLISEDFLNEERFAQLYAGGKFRTLKWGKQKIIQGLKQKQVSDYCIKKGLKEIDNDDYAAAIAKLLTKKLEQLRPARMSMAVRQKLLSYMVQKGYTFAEVMPAIDKLTRK
jgi:regulatory protein